MLDAVLRPMHPLVTDFPKLLIWQAGLPWPSVGLFSVRGKGTVKLGQGLDGGGMAWSFVLLCNWLPEGSWQACPSPDLMYSFIYSFKRYSLRTCTAPSTRDTVGNWTVLITAPSVDLRPWATWALCPSTELPFRVWTGALAGLLPSQVSLGLSRARVLLVFEAQGRPMEERNIS